MFQITNGLENISYLYVSCLEFYGAEWNKNLLIELESNQIRNIINFVPLFCQSLVRLRLKRLSIILSRFQPKNPPSVSIRKLLDVGELLASGD